MYRINFIPHFSDPHEKIGFFTGFIVFGRFGAKSRSYSRELSAHAEIFSRKVPFFLAHGYICTLLVGVYNRSHV